jgi:hypothetical protein
MLALFYTRHKSLLDILGLLRLLQSSLTVAWNRLKAADVPLPLSSRTVLDLRYQLLTAIAHNNWIRAVISLTLTHQPTETKLSCLYRHGPHRKHHSSVSVQLLPWKHTCLRSHYLPATVVWLLISRSFSSNGSTCHNIFKKIVCL